MSSRPASGSRGRSARATMRSSRRSSASTARAAARPRRPPQARKAGSAPEPLSGGIEERLGGDLARDPFSEDLDLARLPRLGPVRGDIRVGDRALDCVAVAAARHAARDLAVDAHRLGAERNGAGIGELQAGEPAFRLLCGEESVASDELALVELDGEPKAGFVRGVVGRDVRAPDAIALLEPHRVDGLVAAGDETVVAPGFPKDVPQRETELARAVQLPAELAHVRHAEREAGDGADCELSGAHVPKREAVGRHRLQDRAGRRAPDPEAGQLRRDVFDDHRAVLWRVLADPGEVVAAERGARDDAEAVLGEARDGEVALDPAARVEHRRVCDLADFAGDSVVAEALQEVGSSLAGDVDLGEARLVEDRRRLAARQVLGADRRGPELPRPSPGPE